MLIIIFITDSVTARYISEKQGSMFSLCRPEVRHCEEGHIVGPSESECEEGHRVKELEAEPDCGVLRQFFSAVS